MQTVNRDIVGDGEQFTGDHHRCKQECEQGVFTLEFQSRECECREDGDYQRQQGGYNAYVQGVQEQSTHVRFRECVGIVLPMEFVREEGRFTKLVFVQGLQG